MKYSVSAVVSSFRRMDYVWDALGSVLVQETGEPYEVLLLTPNPELQIPPRVLALAHSRGREVRTVGIPDRPIGFALVVAAESATGDYLAFLDDDDLWEPGKIRTIQAVIGAQPGLAFLHNGQSLVDERNHELSRLGPHRLIRQSSSLAGGGHSMAVNPADPASFAAGRTFSPDVNNSSVTIQRSVLTGIRDPLRAIRRGEDTFLYYAALATGRPLWVTSDRLTRYRVHGSGNTAAPATRSGRADPWARYLDLAEGHLESLRLIRERVLHDPPEWIEESLRNDEAFWSALAGLAANVSDRPGQRRMISQLLGRRWLRPRPRDFYAAVLASAGFVAPGLSRRAFGFWRQMWF
jgi:glycosyltransferase involved in cell wall biosynthesis